MKYGYICKCGWRLKRGKLTRKVYAAEKIYHATQQRVMVNGQIYNGCPFLAKELAQSKKVPVK